MIKIQLFKIIFGQIRNVKKIQMCKKKKDIKSVIQSFVLTFFFLKKAENETCNIHKWLNDFPYEFLTLRLHYLPMRTSLLPAPLFSRAQIPAFPPFCHFHT